MNFTLAQFVATKKTTVLNEAEDLHIYAGSFEIVENVEIIVGKAFSVSIYLGRVECKELFETLEAAEQVAYSLYLQDRSVTEGY